MIQVENFCQRSPHEMDHWPSTWRGELDISHIGHVHLFQDSFQQRALIIVGNFGGVSFAGITPASMSLQRTSRHTDVTHEGQDTDRLLIGRTPQADQTLGQQFRTLGNGHKVGHHVLNVFEQCALHRAARQVCEQRDQIGGVHLQVLAQLGPAFGLPRVRCSSRRVGTKSKNFVERRK